MNSLRPPDIGLSYYDLPTTPKARHEALVDIFGECIVGIRNMAIETSRALSESEDSRNSLGTIKRATYDAIAEFDAERRESAYRFAEAAVDRFARLLLTLLSGTGTDQRMGVDHALRFHLEVEVCDGKTGDVVDRETINRGGDKFFADYFGRWLNRYPKK